MQYMHCLQSISLCNSNKIFQIPLSQLKTLSLNIAANVAKLDRVGGNVSRVALRENNASGLRGSSILESLAADTGEVGDGVVDGISVSSSEGKLSDAELLVHKFANRDIKLDLTRGRGGSYFGDQAAALGESRGNGGQDGRGGGD